MKPGIAGGMSAFVNQPAAAHTVNYLLTSGTKHNHEHTLEDL
jgi:hypothetical protein